MCCLTQKMYCVLLWSTVLILNCLLDMLGLNFFNLFQDEGCTFLFLLLPFYILCGTNERINNLFIYLFIYIIPQNFKIIMNS